MTRHWPLLVALALLHPAAARAASHLPVAHVTIRDHTFIPHEIHVKAGEPIVWSNADQDPHTVTSGADNVDDGRWESSPLIVDGGTFRLALTRPGRYPYYCKPHQYEASMHGTIIITR
jgi:plastocyanin